MLTPEELRKEIYENLLKRRIFLADRQEKIEKALLHFELIPKDMIYCSPEMLHTFNASIDGMLERVCDKILSEKEEVWFDIYRSIGN